MVAPAAAATLPAVLAPPAPFPRIVAQSLAREFVAPGVTRGDYRLATVDGPLVISVVAIDTHDPSVRLGDVVASDHLVSRGETVSSMALRTHAIAGINGDYFDIGQTNQPLGIVISDGSAGSHAEPARGSSTSAATEACTSNRSASKGTATFDGSDDPADGRERMAAARRSVTAHCRIRAALRDDARYRARFARRARCTECARGRLSRDRRLSRNDRPARNADACTRPGCAQVDTTAATRRHRDDCRRHRSAACDHRNGNRRRTGVARRAENRTTIRTRLRRRNAIAVFPFRVQH